MVAGLGTVLAAVSTSGHASAVDVGVFAVAAAIVLAGAIGVVVARNPVHSALMLVMTLFGIAVLFVNLRDPFLAAVQVIVYAGAIVVLFLFVIMFLGVDREENIAVEPLRGQRPMAIGLVILGTTGLLLLGQVSRWTTGAPHVAGLDSGQSNVALLGKSVYTTYLFPFEATAALLVIAVVGAVVLARRPPVAANPEVGADPANGSGGPAGRAGGTEVEVAASDAAAAVESGTDGGAVDEGASAGIAVDGGRSDESAADESEAGVTTPAGAKGESAS
jgi:NADH-quinone oxidoreductase subunit J